MVGRYGICDSVVFSVVETCVEYGGVNVFHVCFVDVCVVYGLGVCVNVCVLLYVVCFFRLGVVCCIVM